MDLTLRSLAPQNNFSEMLPTPNSLKASAALLHGKNGVNDRMQSQEPMAGRVLLDSPGSVNRK